METPVALDLFCGAGGTGEGFRRAGFNVVGVDVEPQPNYPFTFHRADAMAVLAELADNTPHWNGYKIAVVSAGPPCQGYSRRIRHMTNGYPKLIEPVRELLIATGLPYVIENVVGAPLLDPVVLCGTMFDMEHDGFELQRHRLFESNMKLTAPSGCKHRLPAAPVFGHGAGRDFYRRYHRGFSAYARREIMDMHWATREEIGEAIPPVFMEYLGKQVMTYLESIS